MAGVSEIHVPYAVIGTNAVNVLMTFVAVRNFVFLITKKPYNLFLHLCRYQLWTKLVVEHYYFIL